MKVILFDDVPRLGKVGDVVNVAPGHFRNFLAPRNLAVEATPENIKVLEHRKKTIQKVQAKEKSEADALASKLSALTLKVFLRAGENDRLFGSVTSADLVEKLKSAGFDVDKKKIHLPEPIKSLGEFPVEIKLHPEVTTKVTVVVEKAE
ncbi:MAG TPA: 50S ribosomal protein L9 [Candidatus Sumerlaeota bacterium]|nr:MAG: 50S ribosomal protein L9 [candidate division BRC1 bacterium ADurb.Bin183]HOE63646.1 50S ribosomal protein L9 [Candidatus Sumerlaeota bacterium]HRR30659.1 50S ribosomal protein L9 [Candidatus Sumerlaeia bacterium]HON49867.1 50S ribosomal protein L9 [Candidatus Sumerlaeota bacterium]HOR63885.1 50S ribosomal protein L9 [Candidatus Sumerlaeota bacterium]